MMFSPNGYLWRGIPAVIAGILALIWPGATVGAVTVLFAVYAFVGAAVNATLAFRSTKAGPVVGWLLLAVLDVAAGVVALVWPGITALVLVLWIAAWAFVTGVLQIALAFAAHQAAGERALHALGGVVGIVFAASLVIRPDVGALALAQLLGFFLLIYGVSMLVTSFSLRRPAHALSDATRA